ncbi:MAG: riboflavin synthase [Vicinamibacteria bacterium]|jgi:riboflavin synthase|nr:riboflavin synthase [Vicinamibacteria bacterium]
MFTGIIEETGVVEQIQEKDDVVAVRFTAQRVLAERPLGGSIAVNGCCLTAIAVDATGFTCELTQETLRRTAFLERLRPGVRVNLERPMRADGRFDGHIVQGHVDGVGCLREARHLGASAEYVFEAPRDLMRYMVEKGSVAIDGISLTIARMPAPDRFEVALIPFTLDVTNLGGMPIGERVNLEVDVVAKYVERLMNWKSA